jgi:hypothetical protein
MITFYRAWYIAECLVLVFIIDLFRLSDNSMQNGETVISRSRSAFQQMSKYSQF